MVGPARGRAAASVAPRSRCALADADACALPGHVACLLTSATSDVVGCDDDAAHASGRLRARRRYDGRVVRQRHVVGNAGRPSRPAVARAGIALPGGIGPAPRVVSVVASDGRYRTAQATTGIGWTSVCSRPSRLGALVCASALRGQWRRKAKRLTRRWRRTGSCWTAPDAKCPSRSATRSTRA